MISDVEGDSPRARLEQTCRALIEADWARPDGPIRFDDRMAVGDLAGSEFFHNARLLLQTIAEAGEVQATPKGNLKRDLVSELLPQLRLNPLLRRSHEDEGRVTDEPQIAALHLPRVVAELAGLLRRRTGKFTVTRQGLALLTDECAGALYRTLFLNFFRKLNLAYAAQFSDLPEFQESMAVTLWRLDDVARGWQPAGELAPLVLLPAVLRSVEAVCAGGFHTPGELLISFVLTPLLKFGLIQRASGDEWPRITEQERLRLAPLWRKFISFHVH